MAHLLNAYILSSGVVDLMLQRFLFQEWHHHFNNLDYFSMSLVPDVVDLI
jgi:hypothetical protein